MARQLLEKAVAGAVLNLDPASRQQVTAQVRIRFEGGAPLSRLCADSAKVLPASARLRKRMLDSY